MSSVNDRCVPLLCFIVSSCSNLGRETIPCLRFKVTSTFMWTPYWQKGSLSESADQSWRQTTEKSPSALRTIPVEIFQIAGAFYGYRDIDPRWISNLERWDDREVALSGALLCLMTPAQWVAVSNLELHCSIGLPHAALLFHISMHAKLFCACWWSAGHILISECTHKELP